MIACVILGVAFALCLDVTSGRRYDVEIEAVKLFGEPLSSVIARLRRTPEYLDILNDKLDDLKKEKENFSIHLLEWYRVKLVDKLQRMYNVTSPVPPSSLPRSVGWPKDSQLRRQADEQSEQNNTDHFGDMVSMLDNHPILHHDLSVDERNKFKDMGFELAGEYIHSLISSLEPSDAPHPSTLQPWGDFDIKFNHTTPHSHSVTQASPITIYLNDLNSTQGIMTSPPKYYKQRHKLF